jgi:tetratricopeptide (TPR) repeat protein
LKAFRGPVEPRELGLAWARIANAQQRGEDFDRARALLNRAYANGARDAAVATVLAFLEDKAGNEDRAIELYEIVRSLDPSQAEALLNLGSSYATRGRLPEAVDLWREVIRRSPGLESAWVKLATAYAVLGRTKEAEEAVQRCLEFHPDSQAAIELKNDLARRQRAP